MQVGDTPVHHSIVVVDIEKFSGPDRSDLHREIAYKGLNAALDKALVEADIDPGTCEIQTRGDGALVLVPNAVPAARLADDLPLRLNAHLLRYNAGVATAAQIRLRMSLHRGDARRSDNGIVGDAVNFACRLVDAEGVRQAHQESSELIAIIASDVFYRDVVQHEPAARPELYREVEVRVKEVRATAWVRSENNSSPISAAPDRKESRSPVWRTSFLLGKDVDQGLLWPLVQALSQLPSLLSMAVRDQVVGLLDERLGVDFTVEPNKRPVRHLFAIAEACCQRPGGLDALLEALGEVESDSSALSAVGDAIRDMSALELWSDEDREALLNLLADVVVPEVAEIFHAVAGDSVPRLHGQTSYLEMFESLEALNADPSGVPRPLVFIEHVAARVNADLAGELRRWSDEQATRMDLHAELAEVRRVAVEDPAAICSPPQNSKAYIVVQIQREGPSGERYRLSHWRQLDLSAGWAPIRGEDVLGDREIMRRHVGMLVERAEIDWLAYQPEIRLEFVLAYENLDLDVEQWAWETDSPIPEPLGCRYTVSIRSLERMELVKYHRSWRRRWASLRAQVDSYGAIPPIACHRTRSHDAESLSSLMAELNRRPELVALVLSEPPQRKNAGRDEFAVAVRAGVPVIAWLRDPDPPPAFLAAIEEMLCGVDDADHLLERVRRARNTALEHGPGQHFGSRFALVYDDPFHDVVPTRPTPPEGASVA
jgi:hypothetical protein